ncbi:isopentenyl-diphosphate Delta-isomerase [Streptomyces ficellus]|uniref:Isopentenyl-diphosphate Delta-isomerase n=1 Tax=Streptomyces ficellus TaxID=1977088 RepID=A0ABT7Z4R4_9ACTN|nr:isopentenyl-diphosphate Delta-isomerase [Streptomyces ficellus]MDN3294086.1 isopentenyl-diphosphate Delta-isomerase [Streptomyces ficellus]
MPSPATVIQESRERLRVELVDPEGRSVGHTTVHEAHFGTAGLLHRAFSVMLVNERAEVLLQRRSATKRRFPGLWSNTCCGHPAPGQTPLEAARGRLVEELGIRVDTLRTGDAFRYRAEDPGTGYVEHEYDHVLVGDYEGDPPAVDPAEVSEVAWRPLEDVLRELRGPGAAAFTPWFVQVAEETHRLCGVAR